MRRLFAFLFVIAAVVAAARPPAAPDVSGKWQFSLETPGGERTAQAEFKQDGEILTGKWEGAVEINTTIKDGKFEFSFPYTPEELGEQGTLKFKLQLEGDTLTGVWEFGDYNGACKGVRKS